MLRFFNCRNVRHKFLYHKAMFGHADSLKYKNIVIRFIASKLPWMLSVTFCLRSVSCSTILQDLVVQQWVMSKCAEILMAITTKAKLLPHGTWCFSTICMFTFLKIVQHRHTILLSYCSTKKLIAFWSILSITFLIYDLLSKISLITCTSLFFSHHEVVHSCQWNLF